jgi:hypothetical protein
MKWLSPGSFVLCAIAFAGVFTVLHLVGLRERTSVFCGTLPVDRNDQVIQGFMAVSYTLFYMATVIAAPILVLAAGVFQLLTRLVPGRGAGPRPEPVPGDERSGAGALQSSDDVDDST